MAKKSSIEKNNRRRRMAKQFAGKRSRLKTIVNDHSLPMEERFAAQLKLSQAANAKATLDALRATKPHGYLSVATMLAEGEVAEAMGDFRTAVVRYETLANDKSTVNDDVLARLGRAALAANDRSTRRRPPRLVPQP